MKKLLFIIPILLLLCWCSVKKDFWKSFICKYDNWNFKWILVWETENQYMLVDEENYSYANKPMKECKELPIPSTMMSWYEYLSWHFTR